MMKRREFCQRFIGGTVAAGITATPALDADAPKRLMPPRKNPLMLSVLIP